MNSGPWEQQRSANCFERRWAPVGVALPQKPLDPETIALIIRITGGNFRLLNRLLTQTQRILEINSLKEVTKAAVTAARESSLSDRSDAFKRT
jgi:hypothetical protein